MKKKPSHLCGVLPVVVLFFLAIIVFSGCKKGGPCGADRSAKGSLQSETGNCLPGTVHGMFYGGVAPSADTNYVEITVDVSKAGYYRIVSDVQNGVQFADSGVFMSTGLQAVRLKAIGVFTNPSPTSFAITFDKSACGFLINVGNLPLADNTWRFTALGRVFSGTCSYHFWYIPNHTATIWEFTGKVPSGDTILSMVLGLAPDLYDVPPGTYPTNLNASFIFYVQGAVPEPSPTIFLAANDKPDKVVKIVVSGNTFETGSIQYLGTFSGTAGDSTGAPVQITNGAFRVGSE
jgi:hypothetical protein